MSLLFQTLLSLLFLQISALPTSFPLSQRCTPSSTFNLQAVSSDPTINDIVVSITGEVLFLNSTRPTSLFTTFFKNDTNHLFAYANIESDDGATSEIELVTICAENDGPVGVTCSFDGVEHFIGDYVASDVAFPDPMGELTFTPEGDDGTALGGWWACPFTTSTGSYQAVMNGAPGFDGTFNFGLGAETCQEIGLQIKPIESIDC